MHNEPNTEYYREHDTPTIHDLGIWQGKEKSTIKEQIIEFVPVELREKRTYAVTYPLNEKEKEYCEKIWGYKFLIVVDEELGRPIYTQFGPTRKYIAEEKARRMRWIRFVKGEQNT